MDTVPHSASNGNLYTVYALIDPRDNIIRYIGITDDVYRRFKEHLAGEGKNPPKDAWIETLKIEQVMLFMKTLDTTNDYHKALALESEWIRRSLAEGYPLFNLAGVVYTPPKKNVRRSTHKLARYDGRFHCTSAEIDEILDAYILWGILPQCVSERQRRTYKKHPRLEDRRRILSSKRML